MSKKTLLTKKAVNALIRKCQLDTLIVPSTYDEIDENAFSNFNLDEIGISTLIIPDTIEKIGMNAFNGINISNIKFGTARSLEIASNAFSNCRADTLTISAKKVILKTNAFFNSKITEVIISGEFTNIPKSCFEKSSINKFNIPDCCGIIEENAFLDSEALEEVRMPESKIKIGADAFKNTAIKSISVCAEEVPFNCFRECANLKKVILTNVSSIKGSAFAFCSNLERVFVTKNDNMTNEISIESMAFMNCKSLVEFNSKLTIIKVGESAFCGCAKLENIDVSKVEIIESRAFACAESLKTIEIASAKRIGCFAFLECKNLYLANLGDRVVFLENDAFSKCSHLREITLPESVKEVRERCFAGCENLSKVEIKSTNLSKIDDFVFEDCKRLTSVKISLPEKIKKIGEGAFKNCYSLKDLPEFSNIEIGDSAFLYCENIEQIKLKDVLIIGANAFKGCKKISDFEFGNTLREIGNEAFAECFELKTIKIPHINMGANVFLNSNNLETINFVK